MKEALKLALDALRDIIEGSRIDDVGNRNDDGLTDHDGRHDFKKRIANAYEALQVGKQALAQEQEPVAWMCNAFDGKVCEQSNHDECENSIPLYTTPPQRTWVGLTDAEIDYLYVEHRGDGGPTAICEQFAKAYEAYLKEKNT